MRAPYSEKPLLRTWAKERQATLDMPTLSAAITARIAALPEFAAARTVMLYLAMPGEIDVERLIAPYTTKTFLVPRCAPRRRLALHAYVPETTPFRSGPFGIREPDPTLVPEEDAASVNMVIVPALLLSERGERLGYGGGYYDRFLPTLPPNCLRLGALPEALVVSALPSDPWDIPLQKIVTESRSIDILQEIPG